MPSRCPETPPPEPSAVLQRRDMLSAFKKQISGADTLSPGEKALSFLLFPSDSQVHQKLRRDEKTDVDSNLQKIVELWKSVSISSEQSFQTLKLCNLIILNPSGPCEKFLSDLFKAHHGPFTIGDVADHALEELREMSKASGKDLATATRELSRILRRSVREENRKRAREGEESSEGGSIDAEEEYSYEPGSSEYDPNASEEELESGEDDGGI